MNIEFNEANFTGFDRIDRENRLLRGVAILGKTSSNKYIGGTEGTSFSEAAFNSLVALGEGSRVFLDHAGIQEDKDSRGVRKVRDLVGSLEAVRIDGDRVKADLKYMRQHKELIEDIVESMADKIGFSIHAFGSIYNTI